MVKYVPKSGDVIWLDFDPQKGKEIRKIRPALTISPVEYNLKTSLALFLPITSKIKGYPFELLINIGEIHGAVLCDQMRSLDWRARNARYIGTITPSDLEDVLARFRVLLPN